MDLSKMEFLTPIQTDDFKEELRGEKIKVSFGGGYVISTIPKTGENGGYEFKIDKIEATDNRNEKKLIGYLLYRDEYLEARKKYLRS